jgi:hypothetical protein
MGMPPRCWYSTCQALSGKPGAVHTLQLTATTLLLVPMFVILPHPARTVRTTLPQRSR